MPRKSTYAYKSPDAKAKAGRKKPTLRWRVISLPMNKSDMSPMSIRLMAALCEFTDEGWRIFAITSHDSELLVSAYLSSWNAPEENTDGGE